MLKKVLFIDLTKQSFETKSLTELNSYIGGVGIGLRLLYDHLEKDPIVFSVGPLNGFFPFASKTSIVFQNESVIEDLYLGGTLSARIRFTGLDSIVLLGKSQERIIIEVTDENVIFRQHNEDPDKLGLPGKRSVIKPIMDKYLLDDYFTAPENFLENKISEKNVTGIIVTGTRTNEIYDKGRYQELYTTILEQTKSLSVEQDNNPSCAGCPMGCKLSKIGEIGGNVMVHSLVACTHAEPIYSNIGVVFSCLNILGYDYTHEDIEILPNLIQEILGNF